MEENIKDEVIEETENTANDYYEQPQDEVALKRDEYLAMAQRIQADFDNFRKRNANVRADAIIDGKLEAIKAFLPVVDNLERAVIEEQKNQHESTLLSGLILIIKQIKDMLASLGVAEVGAVGEDFDPNLHNAVLQAPPEGNQKSGQITEVFAKGYKLGDKVIRYTMVKVAI